MYNVTLTQIGWRSVDSQHYDHKNLVHKKSCSGKGITTLRLRIIAYKNRKTSTLKVIKLFVEKNKKKKQTFSPSAKSVLLIASIAGLPTSLGSYLSSSIFNKAILSRADLKQTEALFSWFAIRNKFLQIQKISVQMKRNNGNKECKSHEKKYR